MNSIKTNIYPENDYRTYLIHYGKKGQKWGVRNAEWYPIADWEAHLKRTGGNSKSADSGRVTNKQSGSTSSSSGSSKAMAEVKAILDGKKTFKSKTDMLNAVCQDCFCPGMEKNYKAYKTNKSVQNRANAAADLGLRANEKLGYDDLDSGDDIKTLREWFLFEDQTRGRATIADMINRGYSAEQVKKLIDTIEENSYDIYNDDNEVYDPGTNSFKIVGEKKMNDVVHHVNFLVSEGNYDNKLKDFADACEQVKNEQSGKVSDSQSGQPVSYSRQEELMNKNGYQEDVSSSDSSDRVFVKNVNKNNTEYSISIDIQPKVERYDTYDSEDDINKKIETAAKVQKNFDQIKNKAIEACVDDIVQRKSLESLGITKNELKKQFKLNSVYIPDENWALISFDAVKSVDYRFPSIEIDLKTMKTYSPALDGGNVPDSQSGFFDEDHKQRRALSKELNKMDQKLAWDKRFYYDTVRNTRKFEQQLDKIKDPRSKEYKLVKSRLDASYDDILKKAKGIEKYEKQISDRVDELERRGYKIKERPISRRTMTKGEIAASIGLTVLQLAASPASMVFVPTNKVMGMKYSVKASKQRDPDFKHSEKEREIAAKVKEYGYSSLTDYEKKVYNKAYK